MNCKKCQKSLYEYLDKSFSQKKEKEIMEHLKGCRDCSEIFERENRFSQLLKKVMDYKTSFLSLDYSMVERLKDVKKERKSLAFKPEKLNFVLRPIGLIITAVSIIALALMLIHLAHQNKETLISSFSKENIIDFEEDLMMADPKTDWMERRLIITIVDEKRKSYGKIITSKFSDRVIIYKEKMEDKK